MEKPFVIEKSNEPAVKRKTIKQLQEEREAYLLARIEGTKSIITLLANALRKRGVSFERKDIRKLNKKQLSGYYGYLVELDRKHPRIETEVVCSDKTI